MEWYIWIVIGIICLIIEIFTPGFILFSIGAGAVVAGVVARWLPWQYQLIIFIITTLATFLLMRRFASFLLKPAGTPDSNVHALIGQTGVITKSIEPTKKGYVKLMGEEWSCIATNEGDTIVEGTIVEILKVDGNKVVVRVK